MRKGKAIFNYFSPNRASLASEQKPRELQSDFLVQAKSYLAFSGFQAFLVQHLFPPLEESWLFRHHLQFFLSISVSTFSTVSLFTNGTSQT